jgi:hypothetical protein
VPLLLPVQLLVQPPKLPLTLLLPLWLPLLLRVHAAYEAREVLVQPLQPDQQQPPQFLMLVRKHQFWPQVQLLAYAAHVSALALAFLRLQAHRQL